MNLSASPSQTDTGSQATGLGLRLRGYASLTKPRALLSIVFTTAMTYLIAAYDRVDGRILALTCFGVAIAGGGSLALNQYMERKLDAQMRRTASRPIPSGRISPRAALIFGLLLMLGGYLQLWLTVNPATSIATIICGLSYLLLYTPLKPRTSLSSFVGAIPGAMLPIMGWVAARDQLEIGAWILSAILFLWQIPHTLVISYRHRHDYGAVGMKQLPLVTHPIVSRKQLIYHTLVLIPVTLMPYYFSIAELPYLIWALLLGFVLFALSLRFTFEMTDREAKRLFLYLSLYLPLLLIGMYINRPS